MKGTDQKKEAFVATLIERFKILSPENISEGTYWKRGPQVWKYIRDNVFSDVQKFNKALRLVDVSQPSGVSNQEIINMAVAVHIKATKKMDYNFRTQDPNSWRFYQAWIYLRKLPKFKYSITNSKNPNEEEEEEENESEEHTNTQSTIASVNSETVASVNSETSYSSTGSENATIAKHNASRGGGKGKKATQKVKALELKRKRQAENGIRLNQIAGDISDLKNMLKKKTKVSMLCKAIAVTSNQEKKKQLEEKLSTLMASLDDDENSKKSDSDNEK